MTDRSQDVTDDEALLALLAEVHGAPAPAAVVREALSGRTAFAVEAVTVNLPDQRQRLLRKDFAHSLLRAAGRRRRACREIAVYRDLLVGRALGTAAYHGSVWDEKNGRFWLVLEFVTGQLLESAPFEHWLSAAAWLGRLQGAFAGGKPTAPIEQHDARFFRATAELAHKQVTRCAPLAASRLRAVVDSLAPVMALWAAQPRTLVHGSYRPQNILVDASAARICPIDWEHAAWGAPLYDLAFLAADRGASATTRLLDAYRAAAAQHGVPVPPAGCALAILRSFQLFKHLRSLTRAHRWGYPAATVMKIVKLTEEARRGLAI